MNKKTIKIEASSNIREANYGQVYCLLEDNIDHITIEPDAISIDFGGRSHNIIAMPWEDSPSDFLRKFNTLIDYGVSLRVDASGQPQYIGEYLCSTLTLDEITEMITVIKEENNS